MHERSSEPDSESPPQPAAAFEEVRRAHASELAEDYVEAIADVIDAEGVCRVRDLALRFGVTHVTVTRTIGRLVEQGLAETAPYRPISLTARGRRMAEFARHRHEVVLRFLLAIGVGRAAAERDSEGMEHHIGPETLSRLEDLLHRLPSVEGHGPRE